jgi:hypothetical protein
MLFRLEVGKRPLSLLFNWLGLPSTAQPANSFPTTPSKVPVNSSELHTTNHFAAALSVAA